ncbi:SRPBCC domain-containing protein [Hufsiella ginkgonis]|uniref:Polyketide cyclase n=1 Tax=Hufsiella ginkgonis TaxID=2695274 RepID=A0A7K1XYV4_9SPHI|nr:SRPBCC domain-containing protein [Hufsiella ginkgonis]MXV16017.1 polyketide cyclase [Hufsiella ginkgonis]
MVSNTKDRELRLMRTLNAPINLVWEVWTKPEHIGQWWGPNGFTNTITIMDVVPGGHWHLVMHGPDGTDYPNKSRFIEVIEFKRISYEHFNPHIIATINFEEDGERTHLDWHMLFDSAEIFQAVVKAHNAAEGLKQNVEKLQVYLTNQLTK